MLMLAKALTRKWPEVYANAVNPGWVPTKMGGDRAPDDLEKGNQSQVWLAVSEDPAALISGQYFYHQHPARSHHSANNIQLQDELLAKCARLTGVSL